jgi:DNA-binding FadR family transcriptional regulator
MTYVKNMTFGEEPTEAPVSQGANLVNMAFKAITLHIKENALEPGDRLPSEATLCKTLGVSRTVIREAFRSLSALGLIDLSVGKRATVRHLDYDAISLMIEHGVQTDQISIQQIYDVRRTIEMRTVALATLRRSDAEAKEIMRLAQAMKDNFSNPTVCMEHDLAMHLLIAKASKNPVFEIIVGAFSEVIRQTWSIGWRSRPTDADREAILDNHLELAQAIYTGNIDRAAEMMALHFDESSKALGGAGVH